MALCTVQNVKDFLKITDTDKDTLITSLIPAAQSLIEEYCNRLFEQGAETEYSNGGVDRICLKRYPLIVAEGTPLKVYEDGSRDYGEDTLVDSDDYHVDIDNGIILFDYLLEKSYGAVKVIYTGGYATVPSAVSQACVELVARKLKIGMSGDIGLISKGTPGGINISFSQADLIPEVKIVLDSFRSELSR
jgi:hypothetical protein